jgi:hypothetical protein
MPEIFDDNHYCILAEHVLEVAKDVMIDYNTKAELLTNVVQKSICYANILMQ